MPAAIHAGQSITATPSEQNSQGNPVRIIPANIQWTMDNPQFASMAVDTATGVATFTGTAEGTVNVTVADTKYKLSFTDQLIVSENPSDVPTSIGIVWGQPQG